MEEAVVKRVMPHSNEAEQAVIGSMLMDAECHYNCYGKNFRR